jgi:hypothetical protein
MPGVAELYLLPMSYRGLGSVIRFPTALPPRVAKALTQILGNSTFWTYHRQYGSFVEAGIEMSVSPTILPDVLPLLTRRKLVAWRV